MDAQDANTRKLLEKDNPNGTGATEVRPAAARAATTGPTRMSIKEQIIARRREAAAAVPKLGTSQSFPGPLSAGSSTSSVPPPSLPEKFGISSAPVRPIRAVRPKSQLSTRMDESKRPA